MRRQSAPSRSAFTLFEVILALGLSAVLMGVLAMLVSVQLRVVDRGRANVEEAQLARALLHRIADDLRNTVYSDPSSGQNSASSATGATSGTSTDTNPTGTSGATAGDTETEASEEMGAETSSGLPGLYGTATRLEIDVSPVLRPDEFRRLAQAASDPTQVVEPPSDLKTVAYFLAEEESGLGALGTQDPSTRHGLVRRELDRTAAQIAREQAQLQQIDSETEPIAPEVTSIEFSYFDGQEWLEEWDSEAQGGLPTAVEIRLSIARRAWQRTMLDSIDPGALWQSDGESLVYRLVVRMPTVLPPDMTEILSEELL